MELDVGRLRVFYNADWEIDASVDEVLEKTLKDYGYELWASGCDLTNGVRDLAFRFINKDEEK